jgi:hypothetical protein
LPGQAALDFQIERKAQEGSDQDNASKDSDALKCRGGGDGADDVTCDEKLQSEENRTPEPHTVETVCRTDIIPQATQELHTRSKDSEQNDRDSRDVDALANVLNDSNKIRWGPPVGYLAASM